MIENYKIYSVFSQSIRLFVFMLFLVSCDADLDNLEHSINLSDRYPDSYSTNFNITYSDSAKLKVNITGKHLEQYTRKKELQAFDIMKDSVRIKFFNTYGKVSSEMKADHTIRYHDTEIMNAKGNVEVINKKGEKLNSERLTWNKRTQQIVCDTTVTITKPTGQVIIGSSLVSDQNFENYSITEVTGKLPFEREEAPK